jgi:hypothetical protein
MEIINRLVQEELYEFLNTHPKDIGLGSEEDPHIYRVIDENSTMYYPYENIEDAEKDARTIGGIILKLTY